MIKNSDGGHIYRLDLASNKMENLGSFKDPRADLTRHLGLWEPQVTQRSPPLGSEAWPVHASLPLTYHPVPDIG